MAEKVIAYGFEKAGLTSPEGPMDVHGHRVIFASYDSRIDLSSGVGAIVPQGIFERIESSDGYGGRYDKILFDRRMLLLRDRQVFNLIQSGGWVCFLVGQIVTKLENGGSSITARKDTDLCRKVLAAIDVTPVSITDGSSYLRSSADEFREFVNKYGVARTYFRLPYDKEAFTSLVESGYLYGFEWNRSVFFLPAHFVNLDKDDVSAVVTQLVTGIADYRKKNVLSVPDWLSTFVFKGEQEKVDELAVMEQQRAAIESSLNQYSRYKAILTTSGENLHQLIGDVLEFFFGLDVDRTDEGKEDLRILADGNTAAFVEVKGTNKGVKREHINQVDSHRERAEVGPEISGVLVVNNEMRIDGIEERVRTKIAEEQIAHAKKLNVRIIKTVDLLLAMRWMEGRTNRGSELLRHLCGKAGWLVFDEERGLVLSNGG